MPRQILTIELDGLTAGDYLAYMSDPEPPAVGFGLLSMSIRAQPLADTLEVDLVWEDCVPAPRVALQAAGLPVVAEVVRIDVAEARPAPTPTPGPAPAPAAARRPSRPSRLSALTERAAARLAAQARPVAVQPLVLRWA